MNTNPLRGMGDELPDLDWQTLDPLGINPATSDHVAQRIEHLSRSERKKFFTVIARSAPDAVAIRLNVFMEAVAMARREGYSDWRRVVANVLGPIAQNEADLAVIGDTLGLQVLSASSRNTIRYRKKDGAERGNRTSFLVPQLPNATPSAVKRDIAKIRRLASDNSYRQGYQDAVDGSSRGLKRRFLRVLAVRSDVASDLLRGRFVDDANGRPALDINEAERSAGIAPKLLGESARLEAKLATLAPDFLVQFRQGEFSSVRKAAIAAGVHKDSNAPLMRLRSNWKNASDEDRRLFREWIDRETQDAD